MAKNNLVLDGEDMAFLAGQTPRRLWASEADGQAEPVVRTAYLNLAGRRTIPEAEGEDPASTAKRNSLAGDPLIIGLACERCGTPLVAGQFCCECKPQRASRQVIERKDPLEFGERQRWEVRLVAMVAVLLPDGEPKVDSRGRPCVRQEIQSREFFTGSESELRRAFPDELERERREACGVIGGATRNKIFRLAGKG